MALKSCTATFNGQEFVLAFSFSPAEKQTFDHPGCEAEAEIWWGASTIMVDGKGHSIPDELAGCLSVECVEELTRQCVASELEAKRDEADEAAEALYQAMKDRQWEFGDAA
jgi:hypothetical protein